MNTVNLIFVHGLGGSAIETWTHHPSETCWLILLHRDARFPNVRIATFGYEADFKNILAPNSALGIPDFAKQLLNHLGLYYDDPEHGDVRTPPMMVN